MRSQEDLSIPYASGLLINVFVFECLFAITMLMS